MHLASVRAMPRVPSRCVGVPGGAPQRRPPQLHSRCVAPRAIGSELAGWLASYGVHSDELHEALDDRGAKTCDDLQFLTKEEIEDVLDDARIYGAPGVQLARARAAIKGNADLRRWELLTGRVPGSRSRLQSAIERAQIYAGVHADVGAAAPASLPAAAAQPSAPAALAAVDTVHPALPDAGVQAWAPAVALGTLQEPAAAPAESAGDAEGRPAGSKDQTALLDSDALPAAAVAEPLPTEAADSPAALDEAAAAAATLSHEDFAAAYLASNEDFAAYVARDEDFAAAYLASDEDFAPPAAALPEVQADSTSVEAAAVVVKDSHSMPGDGSPMLPALRYIHTGGQTSKIVFSPCGSYLAAGLETGFVKVWDVRTGKEVAQLNVAKDEDDDEEDEWDEWDEDSTHVTSLSWNADGRLLLITTLTDWQECKMHHLRVPDKLVSTAPPRDDGALSKLALVPDPSGCYSGYDEDNVLAAAAFSPDGRTLAAVSESGTLSVWDRVRGVWLPSGNAASIALCDEGTSNWSLGLCLRPDPAQQEGGRLLAVVGGGPAGLCVCDLSPSCLYHGGDGWEVKDAVVAQQDNDSSVLSQSLSLDGAVLAAGLSDGAVLISDMGKLDRMAAGEGGEFTPSTNLTCSEDGITSLALTPSGGAVVCADSGGAVRLWDVATGWCKATLHLPGRVKALHVAIAPSGQLAAATFRGEWDVAVWSLEYAAAGWPAGLP